MPEVLALIQKILLNTYSELESSLGSGDYIVNKPCTVPTLMFIFSKRRKQINSSTEDNIK